MQVIQEELTGLQLLEASSSVFNLEFNVTHNYLDCSTALAWGENRIVVQLSSSRMVTAAFLASFLHTPPEYLKTEMHPCAVKH